jgi:hypothetical protein
MSKNEQKTVVSGPPESPVALLDQLRNALENPTGRSTESVSDFLINRLANAEALPPDLAAADLEKQKKGPYEIGNIVAQGGMGAIVSAIDSATHSGVEGHSERQQRGRRTCAAADH